MGEKSITFRKSEYSYDQASPDYMKTFLFRSVETWNGTVPFSMTLWVSYYSESIRKGKHWYYHKNYEQMALEMILEGDIHYEQEGERIIANAGELYIIHPGTDSLISSGSTPSRRKLAILFSGNLLGPLLKSLNIDACKKLTPKDPLWFETRFRRIGELLKIKAPENAADISTLAYELIAGLAKEHNRSFLQELPAQLRATVVMIDSNLDKEFKIPSIAAKFNISAPTLTRMFRKYLKKSPQEYLISRRMENAKQLILQGRASLKELALQLGYQDSRYFSTVFKKYTGYSPSEFRKKHTSTIKP